MAPWSYLDLLVQVTLEHFGTWVQVEETCNDTWFVQLMMVFVSHTFESIQAFPSREASFVMKCLIFRMDFDAVYRFHFAKYNVLESFWILWF